MTNRSPLISPALTLRASEVERDGRHRGLTSYPVPPTTRNEGNP